jgi:hypothetical protein
MADEHESERDDLRAHVRGEEPSLDQRVTLRGGPDNVDKLRRHALRTNRAFLLDGHSVFGVSVFCALDDIGPGSLDGLLRDRLSTYRWVHTPTVEQLTKAGFQLLATFGRPHFTLLLDDVTDDLLAQLGEALGPPVENPYHRTGRSGPRR